MGMPQAMLAALFLAGLSCSPTAAQTSPDQSAPAQTTQAQPDPESPGSSPPTRTDASWLSHSAVKALTYKVATTATNITVLSVVSGGVVTGTALALAGTAMSFALYAVNDYSWDSQTTPVKQDTDNSLDVKDEFWRTSKKFLTYKASTLWIKATKLAYVYAYNGSIITTVAAVSTSTLINAGFFYGNNIAWDYYDASAATPRAAAALAPIVTEPQPGARPSPPAPQS